MAFRTNLPGRKSTLLLVPILIGLPILYIFHTSYAAPPQPELLRTQLRGDMITSHTKVGKILDTLSDLKSIANSWGQRPLFEGSNASAPQKATPTSPGWDFWIFWRTGRAADPYAVQGAIYPPPMTLLFRVMGLLPETYGFYIWTGINLTLLVIMFRRRALLYTLFMPTMFHMATGQLDILFMWFSTFLKRSDWRAIVAGALISLKPQIAIILLPWHLLRWPRRIQLGWAVLTAGLWGYYLLFRPQMYVQWMGNATGTYDVEVTATPSIFSALPLGLAIVVSVLILIFSWRYLNEKATIAAGVLAMPFGKTYDAVLLLRSGIPWWIVLLSWASLGLSHLITAPWPQMLVTATVYVLASRESWKEKPFPIPGLAKSLLRL